MLKKIIIVVISFVLLPIFYIVFCDFYYSRYLDEVSIYPSSEIVEIQISNNGKSYKLDKKYYQDFVEHLKTLKKTYKIGYSGERWHYYEEIKINWGQYGKFRLHFKTRDSLGNRILMGYLDKSYFMTFSVADYEATNFYKWLIEKEIIKKDKIKMGLPLLTN